MPRIGSETGRQKKQNLNQSECSSKDYATVAGGPSIRIPITPDKRKKKTFLPPLPPITEYDSYLASGERGRGEGREETGESFPLSNAQKTKK